MSADSRPGQRVSINAGTGIFTSTAHTVSKVASKVRVIYFQECFQESGTAHQDSVVEC